MLSGPCLHQCTIVYQRASVSVSVQPTPTSEPSADMKRRMREEYLGLGGSPNKVRGGWQRVVLQSHCQSAVAEAAAAAEIKLHMPDLISAGLAEQPWADRG